LFDSRRCSSGQSPFYPGWHRHRAHRLRDLRMGVRRSWLAQLVRPRPAHRARYSPWRPNEARRSAPSTFVIASAVYVREVSRMREPLPGPLPHDSSLRTRGGPLLRSGRRAKYSIWSRRTSPKYESYAAAHSASIRSAVQSARDALGRRSASVKGSASERALGT
jgi:hypothetical protein